MRDTLTYDTHGQDLVLEMSATLAQRGLSVVRSFDLRAAQVGQAACVCQDRSISTCECQLVVLLVYGQAPAPLTLVISGCGGQTDIRIAHDATTCPDPHLATEVLDILTELGLRLNVLPAPPEPVRIVEPGP